MRDPGRVREEVAASWVQEEWEGLGSQDAFVAGGGYSGQQLDGEVLPRGVKENRALEEVRSADRDRLNQNSKEQCPVVDTGPRTVVLHVTQFR